MFIGFVLPTAILQGQEITAEGKMLAAALDNMNVEQLWLSKRYVNWKTGQALKKPVTDGKPHTHCSAFVAAACMKLNVYILRPPEHKETLLANAQYDWLRQEGASNGWKAVSSPYEAQRLANQGYLVVATFKEANSKKSGHIAIVRPNTRSTSQIQKEGPEIIQAGMTNFNSTSLKEGFGHHPAAWRDRQVRFYAHALAW
jgi:hypothetical protein